MFLSDLWFNKGPLGIHRGLLGYLGIHWESVEGPLWGLGGSIGVHWGPFGIGQC